MSKIFRLYKGGTNTYEDWNSSPAFPYNSVARDTIDDPDGASARHEITSIPSPFARIDLIKTAFKEVCKTDRQTGRTNLDGDTIFHKMVSDTLDVGEIFFNLNKFKGKVEVIKWEPSLMLDELDNSVCAGHRYLADVLRKYLLSDAAAYNFGQLKNLYLLNYVQGPAELNIIGSTSPATLFFCGANDLSYVNDIYFGEDKPFDVDFQPLYKRDPEYVKYLFALRTSIPGFAGLFPEVDLYLTKTFGAIQDQMLRNDVLNITPVAFTSLSTISVADIRQNDMVEVLGYCLYMKSSVPVNGTSDFTIQTTKQTVLQPLVLPAESGNKYSNLQYTTGKWGKTNAAPCRDAESDLNKRVLPFDGSQYPYLTISDFLEDTIIRVPHTLNVDNYFDGHLKLDEKELAYLLPLRPLLFEYFSPEEVRGSMKDGKPMFEMETLGGKAGVRVVLRIPVKGMNTISYIEYVRLYYNNRAADVERNEGGMTEFKFTGFVMPPVRFSKEADAIYNISCVQSVEGRNKFVFYKGAETVLPQSLTCRNESGQVLVKADNYLLEQTNFDFIRVCNQHGYGGIFIPIFKQQRNVETFEFAIDLGTSNTHIELRKGNGRPEIFGFTSQDRHLCEMFVPQKNVYGFNEDLIDETELIEKDFIPGELGASDFSFPTRTVLSCAKFTDWNNVVEPFTLVNLPFTYDKRSDLQYNNFKYNIKWGNGDDLRVIESYVRCLMLIIRNKVLLNDGDLSQTKITWFYPISMAPKRLRRLRTTWNDAYQKYFGPMGTMCMTESEAPIQYFFRRYATATDLVNVDIGGGTTDIAFAKDKDIKLVTSFRFASNALFENPFSELDDNNGIVDWYKDEILSLLEQKQSQYSKLSELITVFNSLNNTHPANMASFLFGLTDNTILKNAGIDSKAIDFNYILGEDEEFKIVFIFFYTAIIYHVAQIVKVLGLEVPRHISFSGNGSKVIRVITTDLDILSKYTKLVFEKVLGKPYGKELELLGLEQGSNPKEATCKGGIIGTVAAVGQNKVIVFKGDGSGLVTSDDTYQSVNDEYKLKTVAAVERFFKFVLEDMNNTFDFDRNFGVSGQSMRIAREVTKKDLATYLDKGIVQRRQESEADDVIEETFFFYPVKGVIQAISAEIFKTLKNQ